LADPDPLPPGGGVCLPVTGECSQPWGVAVWRIGSFRREVRGAGPGRLTAGSGARILELQCPIEALLLP